MSNKICLFAHYHPLNELDVSVEHYLSCLHLAGFSIILISNSEINNQGRETIAGISEKIKIHVRENKGYDFGAWQYAFNNKLVPADAEYVLLTNDSIIGPLFPLNILLEKMMETPADVWGITDSFEGGWHLQSYFLLIKRQVIERKAFRKFFEKDFTSIPKTGIILEGEIGLSQMMISEGLDLKVVAESKKVDPGSELQDAIPRNNTHFHWQTLIAGFGVPFIKKDLLLKNPNNLKSAQHIIPYLIETASYPIQKIYTCIASAMRPVENVTHSKQVVVLCHLFYSHTLTGFLIRLSQLKSIDAFFIFNVSHSILEDEHQLHILKTGFPGAILLASPEIGRDIGGKLLAIDAMLQLKIESDLCLVIHDKLSPHSVYGDRWRNQSFKLMEYPVIHKLEATFNDVSIGMIGPKELIQNEFDADNNNFRTASSDNIIRYLNDFSLKPTSHTFIAGSIFWIRTSILREFFSKFDPLQLRSELEEGNALDFFRGTNIHAWERLFCFIATSNGYKLKGI